MPKLFLILLPVTLFLFGCGENSVSSNNSSKDNETTTNSVPFSSGEKESVFCPNGEVITNSKGIVNYVCSDNQWVSVVQQISSSQNMTNISTCQDGEMLSDGKSNYVCSGEKWIFSERPNSSSQAFLPDVRESSSSIKQFINSSSSEKKCKNDSARYIWLQRAYTTDTSKYKVLEYSRTIDVCKNGEWEYPSNICDFAVAGQIVPSENKNINGVLYHIWCDDNIMRFDLGCEREGLRDTVVENGKLIIRKCSYDSAWAMLVTPVTVGSSSSTEMESSSTTKSSSSSSFVSAFSYGTLKDPRDNRTYKTVTIGSQTWMAENLAYYDKEGFYAPYTRGVIKLGHTDTVRFYYWSAAMDSAAKFSFDGKGCGYNEGCWSWSARHVQGICPGGWHLPDTTEFNLMIRTVGGKSVAGKMLKSTEKWNNKGNGVDGYGFSAFPDGYCYSGIAPESTSCTNSGEQSVFMTSTENRSDIVIDIHCCWENASGSTILDTLKVARYAYGYALTAQSDSIYMLNVDKSKFFDSIRCIKD